MGHLIFRIIVNYVLVFSTYRYLVIRFVLLNFAMSKSRELITNAAEPHLETSKVQAVLKLSFVTSMGFQL